MAHESVFGWESLFAHTQIFCWVPKALSFVSRTATEMGHMGSKHRHEGSRQAGSRAGIRQYLHGGSLQLIEVGVTHTSPRRVRLR